jgi:hypothetical protein
MGLRTVPIILAGVLTIRMGVLVVHMQTTYLTTHSWTVALTQMVVLIIPPLDRNTLTTRMQQYIPLTSLMTPKQAQHHWNISLFPLKY